MQHFSGPSLNPLNDENDQVPVTNLIPALARIRVNMYDAGHVMYLHEPSGRKFRENVVGFIRETDRL